MNPLTRVATRFGGQPWLPRFSRQIVALDHGLRWVTRGWLSLPDIAGLDELLLTVRGRRSGLPRTTPLLYVPHGDAYLVAGSNWGDSKRPAWVLNLVANRDATVTVRRRSHPVRARQVNGREREELWQKLVGVWPNYTKYAERTDREIPVFVLERTVPAGVDHSGGGHGGRT